MEPLPVRAGLAIPAAELAVSYARSGGPGGQHVNKTETKVVLRFSVARSAVLDDEQRALVRERLGHRLTRDGELVVHASRFRERPRNLEEARHRLAALLRAALAAPARERRPTRPTRGSRERRLDAKRRRGQRKRDRRPPDVAP